MRLDKHGTLTYVTVLPMSNFLFVIIEEDVNQEIQCFLEFSRYALDHIDDSNRLSHCGIAAVLLNANFSDWKTRAEHQRNPDQATMPIAMSPQKIQPITLSPPTAKRSELAARQNDMAEDLVMEVRRAFYP